MWPRNNEFLFLTDVPRPTTSPLSFSSRPPDPRRYAHREGPYKNTCLNRGPVAGSGVRTDLLFTGLSTPAMFPRGAGAATNESQPRLGSRRTPVMSTTKVGPLSERQEASGAIGRAQTFVELTEELISRRLRPKSL